MPSTETWIKDRVASARNGNPLVTELVATRMEESLESQFAKRQLSKTELTSHAKIFLAEMVPATTVAKPEK